MIDWMLVATTAVSFLMPFVKKAGDKAAEKAGEALFNLIQAKLKGDEEAEGTLKRFEQKPSRYETALTDILREKAEADPGFGSALKKLVEETEEESAGDVTQIAQGTGIAQAAGSNASATVSIQKSE